MGACRQIRSTRSPAACAVVQTARYRCSGATLATGPAVATTDNNHFAQIGQGRRLRAGKEHLSDLARRHVQPSSNVPQVNDQYVHCRSLTCAHFTGKDVRCGRSRFP